MTDCIFCRIIAGEIPSAKVYEDEKMLVVKDVAPAAPVHVLLLPKVHYDNIMVADKDLVTYMLGKVEQLAAQLGIKEKGYRLVINTGKEGGQSVNHLHIHLIGGKELGWPPC